MYILLGVVNGIFVNKNSRKSAERDQRTISTIEIKMCRCLRKNDVSENLHMYKVFHRCDTERESISLYVYNRVGWLGYLGHVFYENFDEDIVVLNSTKVTNHIEYNFPL